MFYRGEDHAETSMTYLEVFGGGASVLFNKQPSRRDVLNDYNGDLIHLRCSFRFSPFRQTQSAAED